MNIKEKILLPKTIVALSGGLASAWCADWALKTYPKEKVILYFNDTKDEHPDLYRFLDDLSKYFKHKIYIDADGRNLEELFFDNRAIANNRMPFCSRILKAERLQKFYKDGDTIVFGIGKEEVQRARRIVSVYTKISEKTKKKVNLRFPLLSENISQKDFLRFFENAKIKIPEIYTLGFLHNNCSGGCVRAGKKQWKLLYEKLPEVYYAREKLETDLSAFLEKKVTIFKDESLFEFRKRIEDGNLSAWYDTPLPTVFETECIGICSTEN